jgi:subtilisin family serine protease
MLGAEGKPLVDLPPMRAALALAEACKLAYQGEEAVRRVIGSWQWEPQAFFRKAASEDNVGQVAKEWGFAAQGQGAVILVFRGADSLARWLIQGSMEPQSLGRGNANGGILAEFRALRPELDDIVRYANDKGLPIWCSGHALGGALALLAALELDDVARLVTFGQPMVLDKGAADAAARKLGDHYWRLVNHDDPIPRVTPGFTHAGDEYHFEPEGMQRWSSSEAQAKPFSEGEFQVLRGQIALIEHQTAKAPDEDGRQENNGDPLLVACVESDVSGILSHRIERYIEALRRWTRLESAESGMEVERVEVAVPLDVRIAAGNRPQKLASPDAPLIAAEAMASTGGDGANGTIVNKDPNGERLVPAVLRVQGNWQPQGAQVLSRRAETVAVLMTAEQYKTLSTDGNVVDIEISREAGTPSLEHSIPFTHADKVHAPGVNEEGDKCIFGLIDTGIDILHDAFSDGQGGTRIRALWHQADDSGPSPHDVDPANFNQNYGRLYLGEELDRLIKDHRNNVRPLPGILRDAWNLTSSGHGTHVASIAAGGHFGILEGGMAPKAPIVAVIPNLRTDPGSPNSLGYSLSHVGAVHFLSAVANMQTKVFDEALPMVVNVSLGMNAGPHDGSTPLEVAFTMATEDGSRRGFAIVKSAGNECGGGSHARVQVTQGAVTTVAWISDNINRDTDYLELWYEDQDELRFRLRPPGVAVGDREPNIFLAQQQRKTVSLVEYRGNTIQLELVPGTGHGNKLSIEIKSAHSPIAPGQWELDIMGQNVTTEKGIVDAWVERLNGRPVRFVAADDDFTISIPGTVEAVICVGASDCNKDFSRIGTFSSRGLTRDERQKPDIAAPGIQINAAKAGGSDTGATLKMDGTSMAAPHVAGAIALVMSRRHKDRQSTPGLQQFNARQLLDGLKHSARDRTFHRRDWGRGKLDAEAFFHRMKNL